jgi:hypothetical protein
MGIWPKYADGTDINGVDVCSELGIIATADDSGFLNILNFPSVVEEAPRRMYSGHSSFVQNVRFLPPPVQPGSGSDQRLVPLKLSLRCPAPPLARVPPTSLVPYFALAYPHAVPYLPI